MAHIHTLPPLERLEKTPRSLSPLLNTTEPTEDNHQQQHSIRHFYNKMSGPMDLPMIHTGFTSYKCGPGASPNSSTPALNYQNRTFSSSSISSRASSSSLHTQYSSSSDRSLSSSPGPSTPCEMISRSPLLGHERTAQKPTLPSLHHKHSLGSLQYRPHSPYPPTRQRELEHPRRHSHPHVPTQPEYSNNANNNNSSSYVPPQSQQLPPLPATSSHLHLPLPQRSFSHDEPQEEQYRHHDQDYLPSMHYPHHRQTSEYDRSTPLPTTSPSSSLPSSSTSSSSALTQPMSATRSLYSTSNNSNNNMSSPLPPRYHPYDSAPVTPAADHSHHSYQHSRYPAESPIDRSSTPATDYFHSRHSMASPLVSSPTGSASPSPVPALGFAYHHHHHLPSPSTPLSDSSLRPMTPPPVRSRSLLHGGHQSIIRRQSEPDFHAREQHTRPSLIRHPVELVHRPLSRLHHPAAVNNSKNHFYHHHQHGSDDEEDDDDEDEEDDVMEVGHRRQVAPAHPHPHSQAHLPFHLQQQDRDHDLDLDREGRPMSAEPMSRSPSPGLYGSMSPAVTGSSMSLASLTSSTSTLSTSGGPSMPSTPSGLVRSHSSMSIKTEYGVVVGGPPRSPSAMVSSPISSASTPLALTQPTQPVVSASSSSMPPSGPGTPSSSSGSNNTQLLLCPVCSRAFKPSKNQNCNLRRHLKNVHNMSPTIHPRKCKWDSLPDGRVKDDKDRKERTRKSKRLWARKFRLRRKVEEAAVVLSMLREAI
ncbi:hypothetical protein BGZ73_005869 [Actinomortierella ambigua]|nr:hypothetical protein BGZ73_005869 [Actinomortierella ambigua]